MKILKDIAKSAQELPKEAWIAAALLPGGLIAIAIYSAAKIITKNKEKK